MKIVNLSWYQLVGVLILGLAMAQAVQAATCNQYKAQVNQVLYAKNLSKLSELLGTLKRLPDCTDAYLDGIKREMSNLAAVRADKMVRQGRLQRAKTWLQYKYAPVNVWMTQTVRGDIAAKKQQWIEAAMFYNQSLDLMADPKATPQEPSRAEIDKVFKLASESLLLAGTMTTVRSSGQPSGTMRSKICGVKIMAHPIPAQFVFGKATFAEEAKGNVDTLVKHLRHEEPDQVILVGHTDHIGTEENNCKLSVRRAQALKKHLVKAGIRANITTIGKGEYQPVRPYDPSRYSRKQINQINRRVEFAIDSDVSYVHNHVMEDDLIIILNVVCYDSL